MGNRWGAGKEDGEGRGRGQVSTQVTWDQSGRESHHMQRRDSKLVKGVQEQGRGFPGKGGLPRRLSRGLCHVPLI
jgi:hypothetical protein